MTDEAQEIIDAVAAMDLLRWLQSQEVSIGEAIWALAVVMKRMQEGR